MRRTVFLIATTLALASLAAPTALAHEHYQSDDGKLSLVLGEQNEPVYTYDWTNLDFIVHETEANGTGGAVPGVHETVNATLVSPGGEELSLPIEPQFGEKGRYQFVEDYYLTQPGQYEIRLEGHINGTDVDGTYKLPGPRASMSDQGFPQTAPTLLDVDDQLTALEEKNQNLRDRVDTLESDLADLQTQVEELETSGGQTDGDAQQQNAPAAGAIVAATVIAAIALVHRRS